MTRTRVGDLAEIAHPAIPHGRAHITLRTKVLIWGWWAGASTAALMAGGALQSEACLFDGSLFKLRKKFSFASDVREYYCYSFAHAIFEGPQ